MERGVSRIRCTWKIPSYHNRIKFVAPLSKNIIRWCPVGFVGQYRSVCARSPPVLPQLRHWCKRNIGHITWPRAFLILKQQQYIQICIYLRVWFKVGIIDTATKCTKSWLIDAIVLFCWRIKHRCCCWFGNMTTGCVRIHIRRLLTNALEW